MTKPTRHSPLRLWSQRALAATFLAGQVIVHLLKGKIHRRNTLEQLRIVGPDSLGIMLLTATTIGMVFTVEVAAEFLRFGVGSAVGGVLAIALGREMAPLITAVVLAGRVGSAFAAEIGTMQVTEQIDALYMLKTDPIDYLVTPRVLACCIMTPILTILSFVTGMIGGMILADTIYNISNSVFLDSVQLLLKPRDLVCGMIKGLVFGWLIAVIGSSWGLTTSGGAKGVGQSTTTAVVTALLMIFISNFFLSWLMFSVLK
ncbi:MlaE family lipid ABC transporter permease subunit [Leptolyngbya sp. NK1-12]|uniref:MlaE family lipid ABC transporter permease subunit n=1 Tax=Leptolyngbya sp. NK1-12 TaxID=2547451 RepID=A0AA96WBL3_9CYAN|nr:MlaE family lipid ABC transporter permease subunit [Leptolyngbya sp. NK1-12]WNZ22208.1 MlaE family lipid ABC transporter permease subunit [Leptolyngbya sp. NK1-12]